jgi:ABC-type phosphate transport system permease subunit
MRPAIQGSLALISLGLMVSLPFGVGAAIYLSEYKPLSGTARGILQRLFRRRSSDRLRIVHAVLVVGHA